MKYLKKLKLLKNNKRWMLVFFICAILIQTKVYAQHLSIFNAVEYALKNNKTVLYTSIQNFLSARAQLNSIEALYNPSLNVQASFLRSYSKTQSTEPITGLELYDTYQFQQLLPSLTLQQTFLTPLGSKLTLSGGLQTIASGISTINYQTSPTLSLIYQQPLSPSGINSGHIDEELAKKSYQQSEINYELQKEELALLVIQNYFQFWQAIRDVEQSARDKESAQRILDLAEIKLKHGSIAEFEVLNLRVQYNISEDNILQSQNNLKTQAISFLKILNFKLDTVVTLDQNIAVDSIGFSLNEAIEKAIKNRLEIKQAEIILSGAKLSLDQTASSTSPLLQVNANSNFNSNIESGFLQTLNMPNYGWNIQGTISFPIFDGGRISSQVEISERNIAIQQENLVLLKEDIEIDIENRYRTLMLDVKRIGSLKLNLEAASDALNIAELRFNSGEITSTDIENVRNRYNIARNTLDVAKASCMIERAGLAKAMGELFTWIESLKEP